MLFIVYRTPDELNNIFTFMILYANMIATCFFTLNSFSSSYIVNQKKGMDLIRFNKFASIIAQLNVCINDLMNFIAWLLFII